LKEYNLWNKTKRTVAWYNAQDQVRDVTANIDEEKKCLEKAHYLNLELEDLHHVMGES
jgi:hypothetical protein